MLTYPHKCAFMPDFMSCKVNTFFMRVCFNPELIYKKSE